MSSLAGIKARRNILKNNGYTLSFADEDIEWLIEQAERVQELEEDSKDAKFAIDMLQAENQRYREAIKGAIGKFNYDYHQEGMAELLNVLEESK